MSVFFQILNLIGGLGLFLYGMHVMSDRIHKRSGERLRRLLRTLTRNRFAGIGTGLGITSIIQSSSATTVLLVSLVNAGLVTLEQAIGVIMGANIGTTLTAWIVAVVGFKLNITSLCLPAVAVAIPMYFNKQEAMRERAEILLGFAILFLGLHLMKETVPDLNNNPEVLAFVQHISGFGYISVLLFVVLGTLLTIVLQSSSAAMAITITMAFKGWITFPLAAAIVLGENVGTTVTAYLASLGMNTNARRTARAHMLFNLFGVAWMLALFPFFWKGIDRLVPGMADDPAALPVHISAFHTAFNLANTALMIGFVAQLAAVTRWMVKRRPSRSVGLGYRLPFIPGNVPEAVESNLINVRSEIGKMSEIVYDMLLKLMNIAPQGNENLAKTVEEIHRNERRTDEMQQVIIQFLTECMVEALSEEQAYRISAIQRITSELESIGDSCENMADLFRLREKKQLVIHETGPDELIDYTSLVLDFLRYNGDYLTQKVERYDLDRAFQMERAINKKRKQLRKISRNQLVHGADVQAELVFMDLVKNLEHIGDYSLNISQAIRELQKREIPAAVS